MDSNKGCRGSAMNWNEHYENRSRLPHDELIKYAGMQVAWSIDGRRIFAGDEDLGKLLQKLNSEGYKPEEYVTSYIDRPDEWTMCGGLLFECEDGE